MTEEQIVKEAIELTTPLWTGYAYVRNATIQCRYELLTEMINLVNHKNEQTEALISGQESLQKHIERQNAEIEQKDIEINILIQKKETAYDEVSELKAEVERLKSDLASREKQLYNLAKEMEGMGNDR